jgi:hypothetical protein
MARLLARFVQRLSFGWVRLQVYLYKTKWTDTCYSNGYRIPSATRAEDDEFCVITS